MATLFLIVLVLVSWIFVYHYALGYIISYEGVPQVQFKSSVYLVNNGQLAIVEIYISDYGYYPFVINSITLISPQGGSLTVNKIYLSFQNPTPYTLPYTLRQGTSQIVYAILPNNNFFQAGTSVVVQMTGTFGSSTITVQSGAEVS